jgi:hypothetical protein
MAEGWVNSSSFGPPMLKGFVGEIPLSAYEWEDLV